MEGKLSKMITTKNHNVDLANLPDEKLMYTFAKEVYLDEKALDKKSTRDKFLVRLLQPPAIMTGSLKKKSSSKPKETQTVSLSSNHIELCDGLKILLQEKIALILK